MAPEIKLLSSPRWKDYDLLDSGDGLKLERFGPYTFVRPEVQALWRPSLPATSWDSAHAVFQPSGEESGGHWEFKKKVPAQWEMNYTLSPGSSPKSDPVLEKKLDLRFSVMTTPGRHLGVFPECASHWDWMAELISNKSHSTTSRKTSLEILNLFGYTGLATLTCAAAGAKVTHVDASRKSVSWAHANLDHSGLAEKPVRWVVDDALKFVEREARRGVKYDGIMLDPPKFGRGPKGEVWEIYKSLPRLLQACRAVLSDRPLFVVLTIYAVKLPAIHAYTVLAEMMKGFGGFSECGELVTVEKSAGRFLSQAVHARWKS
jgi:23S rRNA (cytosine1962-C5)-methyltransferase